MKYIDLYFLPFKINKKYSKAIKEINIEDEILLFNKYNVDVKLYKYWFDNICVDFIFPDLSSINQIEEELMKTYGEPTYCSYNDNLKIWKHNKVYVTHGQEEQRFQDVYHILRLSFVKPGFITKYKTFKKYDILVSKIKQNYNFKKVINFSIGAIGEIRYLFETINCEYIVEIYKKKIEISIIIKNGNTSKLLKIIKYKYQNDEQLYNIINNFFNNQIPFDKELYK